MKFEPSGSAKDPNYGIKDTKEVGVFSGCCEELSFKKFCDLVFNEDIFDFSDGSRNYKFYKELIAPLSSESKEILLLRILEEAASDWRFFKTATQIQCNYPDGLEALGSCYIRSINSVFEGECSLTKFQAACGYHFKESYSCFVIDPKQHEIFRSVLPMSFYEDPEVQSIIKSQIFNVVKFQPVLLSDYLTLPGYKEAMQELLEEEVNSEHFRDCLEEYLYENSGADIKDKANAAEKTIRDLGLSDTSTFPLQLVKAIDLLGHLDLIKKPRFIACVGRQIEAALESKRPISAINWLSLLPRDPDNNMRLTSEAQRYVKYSAQAAYDYAVECMNEGEFSLKGLNTLVRTIRNFIPVSYRNSDEFFEAVTNACNVLGEMRASLAHHRSLVKTLPLELRNQLVEDDSYVVVKLLPVLGYSILNLNAKVEHYESRLGEKVDESLSRELAKLDKQLRHFKEAAGFFGFDTCELKELPPEARKLFRTYHYLTDLSVSVEATRPQLSKISVSLPSWRKLVDRAEELLIAGRFHKAQIYVDTALALATKVPDIDCEDSQIARLFNLKAASEVSSDKQADWLSKELYLRMRILDYTHKSFAPIYRSFSEILNEKAEISPPGENREEILSQASLCATLAEGIEEVNRFSDSRQAIMRLIEHTMRNRRLHEAVGFNTEFNAIS